MITKATDCTYVQLRNDDITNHDDSYTLSLIVTDVETSTSTTTAITAAMLTVDGTDTYYQHSTSGASGVYKYSLVKTVGTTKTYYTACVFLDCSVRCDAVGTNIETSMLHYSISLAEDCDCDCENMKEPYELLKELLVDTPCTNC
jgi:hypothetical protein